MNEIPPVNAAQLLKQYGLWAVKGLGQNFLEDPLALQQIATAADIQKFDAVLEIGAGLGSLTRYLSVLAGEVVTVELDRKLTPVLRSLLKPYRNTRLVEGNILELSPAELGLAEGYIVAANIPYNITSAILRHLLESKPKPRRMVLTVQKEVAERICSTPPHTSLLSLSVQVYGNPRIVAKISASSFFPVPKVDSTVVRIDLYPEPVIPHDLLPHFFQLSKACFSQKRKTLRNALSAGGRISTAHSKSLLLQVGVDPQRRAETLSLPEWEALTRAWTARHQSTSAQPRAEP
jgi:16S rRNA (adenine1518-N6/adenine1519-N6)-dimethyltransferase